VRLRHFETLRPVCPVCRGANDSGFPLRIAFIAREEPGHILEGALHCTNANCLREFPIIDGIPLIIVNIRQYVSENALAIYSRRDLSDFLESMLGDCCGPGSAVDVTRQHLSSYGWDHYGDCDPAESPGEPRAGSLLKNIDAAFQSAGTLLTGPVIDVGCAVGRGAFELAERTNELILGVDLNFPMLRFASEVLREGTVRYPRRRIGLVYDRREFPVAFAQRQNVDFWACDGAALPFAAETFSMAMNMNVLDCVHAPRDLLISLASVLKRGGKTVLATPYDWSTAATPLEAWLGGHSQRSEMGGSCETVLRTLLTPGKHPNSIPDLQLIGEVENLAWHVRLHERSTMSYKLHLVAAEKL
jgi:SAM-dependent methyltransferase/uncharacterized protein YbaR (Trm112 family)